MTTTEHQLFNHVLRLTSALVIIQQSHDRGHTELSLSMHLDAARRYLQANCPSLLHFVECCYSGLPIPEGLIAQAEQEACRAHAVQP